MCLKPFWFINEGRGWAEKKMEISMKIVFFTSNHFANIRIFRNPVASKTYNTNLFSEFKSNRLW